MSRARRVASALAGATLRVVVTGRLDEHAAQQLRRACGDAVLRGCARLEIDLTEVTNIADAGRRRDALLESMVGV